MDLSDIQGLVFHPYRRLPYAAYVLLRFQQRPDKAREWLGELLETQSIDSSVPKDVGPLGRPGVRLNVAFTYTGLVALGLDRTTLQTFPLAFADGLGRRWTDPKTPDHRSRTLGDVGASAPREWEWGYEGDGGDGQAGQRPSSAVDALLLVFAADAAALKMEVQRWIREAVSCGATAPGTATTLYAEFPADLSAPVKEPFGFVDGLSQPVLKGALGKLREKHKVTQPEIHELEDGEILLGHRDGHRQISLSPTLHPLCDRHGQLPPSKADSEQRDLGYNGTYLVFRQLAQDVDLFKADCETASQGVDIPVDRFKALLVGRWQDGSPLIKCPIAHDPALASAPAANDFDYHNDPHGERCPVGAHIRRANPRDSLGENAEQSWRVANRHRIMRRGRPYNDEGREGLHFICLSADIERQFEFLQQNWINNETFGGLEGEDDPIMGPRQGEVPLASVTLPPPAEHRVARRASGLSRFVTVKGGAYFFLPSLAALAYMARTAEVPARTQPWQPPPAKLGKGDWVRFLLLTRFTFLLTAALVAVPLAPFVGGAWMAAIAGPMFVVGEWWEMLVVAALASLAAAVALITYRLGQLYAKVRFGVLTPGPATLTWSRMFLWQTMSWPIVGAVFWLSANDAARPGSPLWRELLWFGLAALAGYVVSFGVLFTAAAARDRGVRPDNPAECVLVPPSKLLDWLRRKPSAVVQIAGPVVRFVESRTAMWPRVEGYVDHESGRILPGHLAAAMLVVTLGIVYVAGWYWLRPPSGRLGVQLPPIAYLLFLLMAMGLLAAGAAFFLDRFRVPLLTALVAWIAIAGVLPATDHEFQVVEGRRFVDHFDAGATSLVARADEYHRTRTGGSAIDRPIVVVAAGGGGIHQAAWTARVLAGLTEVWGATFSGNLRLISAVSASSVGTMHFVNEFTASGPPRGDMSRIVEAAKQSSTGDIWWGLAYPDLLRAVLPFSMTRVVPGTLDRGWALEQAWHRALGLEVGKPAPTMGDWQADTVGGWRPAVAFNAMIVESGERAVLATYSVPGAESAKRLDAITSNRDLAVTTAARLSASFPYVTPFARPSNSTTAATMMHLTDGGYWDNYGIVSALEWLKAAAPLLANRRVLVVRIPPFPGPEPQGADRPWVWQQIAPLVALESVRNNAQRVRNEREIQHLRNNWIGSLTFVEIPYGPGRESLGWHLTRRERCEIEAVWRATALNRTMAPMSTIASVLGTQPPSTPFPLPKECL